MYESDQPFQYNFFFQCSRQHLHYHKTFYTIFFIFVWVIVTMTTKRRSKAFYGTTYRTATFMTAFLKHYIIYYIIHANFRLSPFGLSFNNLSTLISKSRKYSIYSELIIVMFLVIKLVNCHNLVILGKKTSRNHFSSFFLTVLKIQRQM